MNAHNREIYEMETCRKPSKTSLPIQHQKHRPIFEKAPSGNKYLLERTLLVNQIKRPCHKLPLCNDPFEFLHRAPSKLNVKYTLSMDPVREIIIDGYVWLGKKSGLGQYLFESDDCRIPIIGVAKSRFPETSAEVLFRGTSRRPLYITAAGMDQKTASDKIRNMHGAHRISTLLKQVDPIAGRMKS